jgi:hypothetical protein
MRTTYFQTVLIFTLGFCSCTNNQQTDKNSIFSKQYRDINEFECFKDFKEISSAIIGETNKFDFGISQITNKKLNVIIFDKVVPGLKSTFEILDTLQIRNLKKTEYISFQLCRKDSINDSEIIAVVLFDDTEYFTKVLKAWRANRKTGKIIEIETTGIDCMNEGYGAE